MHRKGQDCKYQYITPKGTFKTFKEAADAEGVTPGAFRKYFKDYNYKKVVMESDSCVYCDGHFVPSSPFMVFCSPTCRKANQFKIVGFKPNENTKCEICSDDFIVGVKGGKAKVMDHCHFSMNYRGTICSNCNTAIGLMKNNVETFKQTIKYLKSSLDLKFTKIRDVKTPNRGTSASAGIDLFIPDDFKETTLEMGDSVLISSGLKFKIPESYALVANNKSGIATKRGLIIGASVIDEDYTGEVHLHLIKVTKGQTTLKPGEKIVQLLLEEQTYVSLTEVDSVQELYSNVESERGEGGFGSTGVS